jgi:integrase
MRALLSSDADPVLAAFIRIAALTGMRIESIAQLRVGDCSGGHISIRRDKTDAGRRVVPMHSALAPLIAARCDGKDASSWLFPECSETTTGARSAAVGKRFATLREGLSITEKVDGARNSLVSFHSFRRWFITEAVRAGQPLAVVQQVVGHKQQGVTMGVYFGGFDMEQLRACVEAVRLPEVI